MSAADQKTRKIPSLKVTNRQCAFVKSVRIFWYKHLDREIGGVNATVPTNYDAIFLDDELVMNIQTGVFRGLD